MVDSMAGIAKLDKAAPKALSATSSSMVQPNRAVAFDRVVDSGALILCASISCAPASAAR
jgi:hypothetical protein